MLVLEGFYRTRKTPISFENVGHVQIGIRLHHYHYDMGDVVSSYLKRLPNLGTLTIKSSSPPNPDEVLEFDEDTVGDWRRDEGNKMKGLKKVEFIIGMLKKRCVDLEEMILDYMVRYLKSFEMASNYAPLSINFLPDQLG
ncbi:uncharacterized protein LOC129293689 isoform X2 [Prosopis cineraria]|uniref:uncharacterized protein LOC129293689 isoform X2 n=1 Tax=Prosopis cineraria TaxID=364024 RepID=UPI00240ED6A8|nr:uncharacterized protein LOC129293689 isoform X2 [Prosopis cineraria]XP_054787745.1 uncharacterized protein LOC129293689 isoform X2 [Prosopis cineraria]XP_054787746.1 uncharacterized protein LOC129293689 isoform X2 [Prosopis cineraria]